MEMGFHINPALIISWSMTLCVRSLGQVASAVTIPTFTQQVPSSLRTPLCVARRNRRIPCFQLEFCRWRAVFPVNFSGPFSSSAFECLAKGFLGASVW